MSRTASTQLSLRGISQLLLRQQGGSFDLKRETGQLALKTVGLHEEFQRLSRKEGQDIKVMMPNGDVMMRHISKGETDYNPEIDRTHLRSMFLNVLDNHVKWASRVKSVAPSLEGGSHQVTLEDGSLQAYDLVIGADGCFSHIRTLVSDAHPEYCGVTFIETYISE
jgi:2-polyprenyl-6-methoxyphenol hydroxylase-like FAD-dependent oxidoreductase